MIGMSTELHEHATVLHQAWQSVDTRPIWQIADGRFGMDRTRPAGERWRVVSCPWSKKILDKWQAPSSDIAQIVLRAGSQTWKTAIMLMALAWSVKHRPVPKLWLTVDDTKAKDVSLDRIHPTLERSPDLSDLLLYGKTEKTTYKIITKLCTIDVAGAESASVLEQNQYGEIFADECRNYKEGRLQKIRMRQRSYRDAKRALFSTPDKVSDEFDLQCNLGSQDEWLFPCMKCGTLIPLVWDKKYSRVPEPYRNKAMFRFEKDSNDIWLECACNHRHLDLPVTRRWILDHGDWVPMNESHNVEERDPKIFSCHWPAMLNPRVVWSDCLKGFRTAIALKNAGNVEDLKLWVNETLGEPWREGQHIEDTEAVKASYRLDAVHPEGKEFQVVLMTNDVGKRDFWHIVRGWNPGAHTRILSAGQLRYWQDIRDVAKKFGLTMTGRADSGLAEGECRRVAIDVRYEDPVEQEVHRTAAQEGWTCLMGVPKPYFELKNEEDEATDKERYLYSQPRFFDSKVGVGGDASVVGVEFAFAEPTAQDILDELWSGKVGQFEHPEDFELTLAGDGRIKFSADTYALHMRNEPKLSEVSKITGQLVFYRKRVGPQHLRDCEKMQVVMASMARCVASLPMPMVQEETNGERRRTNER